MSALSSTQRCPCGTGETYGQCCQPLHAGTPAATAEALMRSRYSAFVTHDSDYLLRTWHPSTRPPSVEFDDRTWRYLDIVDTTDGGLFHKTGSVRFVAHYRDNGKPGAQAEHSRFVRDGKQWLYIDAF